MSDEKIPKGFVRATWVGPVSATGDDLNGRRIIGPGDEVIVRKHEAHASRNYDFTLSKAALKELEREQKAGLAAPTDDTPVDEPVDPIDPEENA